MMLSKECKAHLKESGMGPFEHARFALGIAFELQVATAALVVHAVAPRCCKTYASDKIVDIAERLKEMKNGK